MVNALPREELGPAMGAGLRYVAMSPNIAKVLLRSFLFGLSTIAVMALLPLAARHLVQGGPLTYGVLLGAFGVGALGGAALSGWLRERLSSEAIVRLAFAGFAAGAAVLAASRSPWTAGAGTLVAGACWVLALSLFNMTVQLSTPRWVVGRALALYQTAAFGGMALGSWLWGSVAEAYGPAQALAAAAAAMLAAGLVGLALPLPARAELDLAPLDRWTEPAVALDLRPRSGPIAVSVEYRIGEEDLPEFLAAMQERHRIRRRDGARHWTLMRDLADPTLWVESYQTPTWVEYVRHHQRRTRADNEVFDRIRALHRGALPPQVQRRIVRPPRWGPDASAPKAPIDHP